MTKDEALAMDLALEALQEPLGFTGSREIDAKLREAITAIKQARSAPVQETPFQIGQRLRQEGKGISDLWGAVSSDADMPEAQRGFDSAAQPAPVQEQLGAVCADGGTCHHKCTERCFRRECCAPFSDYVGPWSYTTPPAAQLERLEQIVALARADERSLERERICKAIKEEDDYCVTEGDYMLDSNDCIAVANGVWVRPEFNPEPIRIRGNT